MERESERASDRQREREMGKRDYNEHRTRTQQVSTWKYAHL